MCRLFLQVSQKEESATQWLVTLENSFLHQSISDSSGRPNADGWGIAFLDESQHWKILKSKKSAFMDPNYKYSAQQIQSKVILAHIRRGSIGKVESYNAHPFSHEDWVFVHNGNIPWFKNESERLTASLSSVWRSRIHGETDSEALFMAILSRISHLDPVTEKKNILLQISNIVWEITDDNIENRDHLLGITFFLAHKNVIYGFRFNRSLYYLTDKDKILVASEPIGDYNSWTEVRERDFFVIHNNVIEFFPIEQLLKIKV